MKNKLKETSQDMPFQKEQVLTEHNNCILCGTQLIFTHITNFMKEKVEEESVCPECGVRNKKRLHSLQ